MGVNRIKRAWGRLWVVINGASEPKARYSLKRLGWLIALFCVVGVMNAFGLLASTVLYSAGEKSLWYIPYHLFFFGLDLALLRWHVRKYRQQKRIQEREEWERKMFEEWSR